jgi:toxin ParE1/3/4
VRFHVTKTAERELDEIFVYLARRAGLEVADHLIDSIEERFALLGDYPLLGRKCDNLAPGVFSFVAGIYLIYYRKRRGALQILHVMHGSRNQVGAFKND